MNTLLAHFFDTSEQHEPDPTHLADLILPLTSEYSF